MKYDGENAYVLFACNLHKERNSMRMIAVAADKVTLYAIIGNEVLHGNTPITFRHTAKMP